MSIGYSESFQLENFEGPLPFLLQLVQRSELSVSEISLKEIICQYIRQLKERAKWDVDSGAEFISVTALLLWLKSKMLLLQEQEEGGTLTPEDPLSLVPLLIEHIQCKELAKDLKSHEENKNIYYGRGVTKQEETKEIELEKIPVNTLWLFFQNAIEKSKQNKGILSAETWRVCDKVKIIRELRKSHSLISICNLFTLESPKEEIIVLFLAILELMKLQEVAVNIDNQDILLQFT